MNAITGFVPYLHVQSVRESQAFYERLGLVLDSRFGDDNDPYWARLKAPGCDLMLAKASGAIDPGAQAVLFYLYAPDVLALRQTLLEAGLMDGGAFTGGACASPRSGMVFEIKRPFYMPEGELRVHDPDGYVLLIGQLG